MGMAFLLLEKQIPNPEHFYLLKILSVACFITGFGLVNTGRSTRVEATCTTPANILFLHQPGTQILYFKNKPDPARLLMPGIFQLRSTTCPVRTSPSNWNMYIVML